jgi:hypothetical protein
VVTECPLRGHDDPPCARIAKNEKTSFAPGV